MMFTAWQFTLVYSKTARAKIYFIKPLDRLLQTR
jgi:hypothetical protein